MCTKWLTINLHQIGATVKFLMLQAIDAVLAAKPELDLLGPFAVDDADVKAIHIKKTIYLLAPFVGIFLECNLTPILTWSCLYSAIINARAMVDF